MTSKIKVDNIENQCGGAVVTKCGGTTTISGSVIKSNAIQASDGGNLVSQSGTTITLGASGDTINLASGASQSGFGRSGSVNWDTTAKTSGFTGVSGNGYFINTTGGVVTANLPASPSAGDIMSVVDYTGTAATNNITIGRNGSNINGAAVDFTIFQNNGSVTLVYVDGTEGWVITSATTDAVVASDFVVATGGTITCSGDYRIHTFTGPGSFVVSSAGNPTGSTTVDYLVIAGGAGGGCGGGGPAGGGGAGGQRTSYCNPATPMTITATTFPVTVGAGGAGSTFYGYPGGTGVPSVFNGITSAGGGGGGGHPHSDPTPNPPGKPGGSGGGGGGPGSPVAPGGIGNTPPVSPPQGNTGGDGPPGATPGNGMGAGGGGGSGGGGNNGGNNNDPAGAGGPGTANSITGSSVTRGGGGGGAYNSQGTANGAPGGPGGGGNGNRRSGPEGSSGDANTGGGGGGRASSSAASAYSGGSGIVIIRYKFQ
jgi:hypothetical protein